MLSKQRIEMDEEADSLYVQYSSKPVASSVEVNDDIVIDLAKDGTVVGVDIQRVSQVVHEAVANRKQTLQSGKTRPKLVLA